MVLRLLDGLVFYNLKICGDLLLIAVLEALNDQRTLSNVKSKKTTKKHFFLVPGVNFDPPTSSWKTGGGQKRSVSRISKVIKPKKRSL